jgi:hypothetical protein
MKLQIFEVLKQTNQGFFNRRKYDSKSNAEEMEEQGLSSGATRAERQDLLFGV